MAQCGTTGGYRDHLDLDQEPCDECRAAEAEYKRSYRQNKRAEAAEDYATALSEEPAVEEEFDELADLRENLRMVRAAMRNAKGARDIAGLSRQRMEISARIKALEMAVGQEKEVDPLDELNARRSARAAGA